MEAERLGRPRDVAVCLPDGVEDELPLRPVERLVVRGDGGCGGVPGRRGFEQGLGEILGADQVAFAEHDGALDGVGELADVAGPGVAQQAGARLGGEAGGAAAELAAEQGGEVAGEERDVLAALAQRRQGQR